MTERRKDRRFEVQISAEIRLSGGGCSLQGKLKNISKGGAFISTRPELRLGEQVEIELDSGKLFTGSLVRRSVRPAEDAGLAVKFVHKGLLVRDKELVIL